MEKKGFKVVADLLTKTVGLVFFSLLAIGLGVLFGVLFEGMLRENPEDTTAIVQTSEPVLETAPYAEGTSPASQQPAVAVPAPATPATTVVAVNKVLVGPFNTYQEALEAGDKLKADGYPTYVFSKTPFAVQVGAFSNPANAERLKSELIARGFKVFIKTE